MRDEQTVKIELLSQWKLEAEFRNMFLVFVSTDISLDCACALYSALSP